MKTAGQIAILRFPRTDLAAGKPRPVVLLSRLPGDYDDWLICMISTQLHQAVEGFDEIVSERDLDFALSGLKLSSVIRVGRLAVGSSEIPLQTSAALVRTCSPPYNSKYIPDSEEQSRPWPLLSQF